MKGQLDVQTPVEYIEQVEPERREQIAVLHAIIEKTSKLKGRIEKGMLAYGQYHYIYKSGREGDWFCIGLASNKQYISLYGVAGQIAKYADKLPQAKLGGGCIRFKSIKDVDLHVVEEIVREAAKRNGKTIVS